mmetsp:Transcript_31174/g.58097  ORF Transcript_31174/g.58097 Transcript_31174/m.58097 type:complete len:367 (-) Transcript_31174:131-1231(-)
MDAGLLARFGSACVGYLAFRALWGSEGKELASKKDPTGRKADAGEAKELSGGEGDMKILNPEIRLMIARNRKMNSPASIKNGQSFTPRKGDIMIATYAKCGTTWTMQIVHQLRSGGDMSFEEITEAMPWDVLALDCGQDLDADQKFTPRAFKSHESWRDIAKGDGVKYIYVARNPQDAMLSFYKFLPKWMQVDASKISIEEFVDAIFAGASNSGQIWNHFTDWWSQRQNPDVLWLFFEDLKADLEGGVLRIAKFMGIEPEPKLVQKVVEMSHFNYMKEHQSKFDDHFVFDRVKKQMGLANATHKATKVRKSGGKVGEGKKSIPPSILKLLTEKWKNIVEKQTGIASYEELKKAYKALHPEFYAGPT